MAYEPKQLVLDIETKPIEAYVFGLRDQNIGINQINKDWTIISWAAKWLGKDEVYYEDLRGQRDLNNDKKIMRGIWKLMDQADIVIGQNAASFDIKRLNARFLINGMIPPSTFQVADTLKIARKHFGFTSHKLEYMSKALALKHQKMKHGMFPGFDLWRECLLGNKMAWRELEDYNKADVLATEELYLTIRPWAKTPNLNALRDPLDQKECECANPKVSKNGQHAIGGAIYQRYRCWSCGTESYSPINELPKELRKSRRQVIR